MKGRKKAFKPLHESRLGMKGRKTAVSLDMKAGRDGGEEDSCLVST